MISIWNRMVGTVYHGAWAHSNWSMSEIVIKPSSQLKMIVMGFNPRDVKSLGFKIKSKLLMDIRHCSSFKFNFISPIAYLSCIYLKKLIFIDANFTHNR